jgi:ribonuclease P protein component
VRGRYLAVKFINRPEGVTRFGFAVARKINNKAQKNRLKRRLRSICRSHLKEIRDGADVVVNILSAALDASYVDLEKEFVAVTRRAGLGAEVVQEQT